jgi:hypothetical protein
MTTAATSLLGLALPVTGELSGTWGDTVNNSITNLLDSAVAGTTTLNTDADVTLTTTTLAANQARQAILLCTGARTAQRTITAPAQSKEYTVINSTTGGFAVKIVGVGPTTGVTVAAGASATVSWNGLDFIVVGSTTANSLTVSGNLTVNGTGVMNIGAGQLYKDASGNLGLGVTPSAWGSASRAMQFQSGVSIFSNTSGLGGLGNNVYSNPGTADYYIANGYATRYYQFNGTHVWNTAASGTAGNTITFTQAMTLDASGNLGIAVTSPSYKLDVAGSARITAGGSADTILGYGANYDNYFTSGASGIQVFRNSSGAERARIDTSGRFLVGKTARNFGVAGVDLQASGDSHFVSSNDTVAAFNRLTSDGVLVYFAQDSSLEGSISVSGSTVSYNGGHLARYTQLPTGQKDTSLLKGTVLSNLDEMCVYVNAETNETAINEQLNKTKVSDVEGDVNVAGVFVSWIKDEQHNVDEINMAMTGDMIIRIAQGTTVARGDLLMSAGDGTAKPQGDDIVRAKTIAKVTSTNVTCTYEDGSYCVPCVLMAC